VLQNAGASASARAGTCASICDAGQSSHITTQLMAAAGPLSGSHHIGLRMECRSQELQADFNDNHAHQYTPTQLRRLDWSCFGARRRTDGWAFRYSFRAPGSNTVEPLSTRAAAISKAKRVVAPRSSPRTIGDDAHPRDGEPWLFTSGAADANGFTQVYRLFPGGKQRLWCHTGPSAALAAAGYDGLGVYPAFQLLQGDRVGIYNGAVVGLEGNKRHEEWVDALPHAYPHDAYITINGCLVDGRAPSHDTVQEQFLGSGQPLLFPINEVSWPGAYMHLMNDPRGCGDAFRANVMVTEPNGVVVALCTIPAFDPDMPAASELLWDYGDSFFTDGSKQGGSNRSGSKQGSNNQSGGKRASRKQSSKGK
jgi:hypothetical protein